MQANTDEELVGYHSEEHDFIYLCDSPPRCRPVGSGQTRGSGKLESDTPSHIYDPPPKHYDGGSIDPWAVWDAFDLDRYTANAVKYLLRAGKKDIAPRLDDLKKAANYIAKAIEMEQKRDN